MLVPEWLIAKLGKALATVVFWGVIALAIVGCVLWIWHNSTRDLRTQVNVNAGQAGAAVQSGQQAVETVGNRMTTEQAGAAKVENAQAQINNATDAGGATDAGLAGLHAVRGRPADRGGTHHPVH